MSLEIPVSPDLQGIVSWQKHYSGLSQKKGVEKLIYEFKMNISTEINSKNQLLHREKLEERRRFH